MLVKDWMIKKVQKVSLDDTVEKAVKVMVQKKVGVLPVIDGKKLAGIITQGDIMKNIVAKKKDISKVSVAQVMTKKTVSITPEDSIFHAMWLMDKHAIRQLPVVRKDTLNGLITVRDIIRQMTR